MSLYVVDANVVTKWLVPEVLEGEADRLFEWILSQDAELHAPDLLQLEVGQVLWKKWRAKELVPSEVRAAMAELAALPLQFHGARRFLSETVAIACELERTVYDSTYLALADLLDCDFITADERLLNAVRQTEWSGSVRWLGEWSDQVARTNGPTVGRPKVRGDL